MAELLEIFTASWAIRALIASSMVGVMCGVIGCFIVLRNMSLIGDALAHAILPGIFVAFVVVGYSTIGFFVGSVLAALVTAVVITWIQHQVKTKNDAAIGIVFTAMFSIGVIGISWISRDQGVHLDLTDFLFGKILGISNEDIYLTAVVCVYTLASVVILYRYLFITTFQPTIAQTMGISVKFIHYFLMLLLSFAVVSALRTVGVILVVAMLITPAATALLLSNRLKIVIIISGFIGLISAVLGLILSIVFETTPGPAMAVTATFIYFLAVVFSPQKGLLVKFIRNRNQKLKIEQEDILRQTIRNGKEGMTHSELLKNLNLSTSRLGKLISILTKNGLTQKTNEKLYLTDLGFEKANELVRAHRLWETYLVDHVGLEEGQIHEDADHFEHILTREILDEVDSKLGYPKVDPHGSPIPKKTLSSIKQMIDLVKNDDAVIAKEQNDDEIESELWTMGIMPYTEIKIVQKSPKFLNIRANGKSIRIPPELASKIKVYTK